jgi:limonene-1,2-epoxide hydrolase
MTSDALSPADVVVALIRACEARDLDAVCALVSDDIEYDNVPMGSVNGRDAVRATLAPFLGMFDAIEWVTTHQVASGTAADGVVMNERLDRFRSGERSLELPVAGLFVVRDGHITLWRDYFDMGAYVSALRD